MATYRVTWEIDLEAGDAREAAELALATQRDPDSIATFFTVAAFGDPGKVVGVDLLDPPSDTAEARK